MARIRSIKPEFPQSETMGKLSRDARLLFIQLWTIVDDEGRARAASRMLASLLYPYDDDAPKLIEKWLAELEQHGCIRRYEVDGSTYLDIPNWLKHQKIDRPSPSRLPEYREHSSDIREPSRALDADLGPRTMDQDLGSDIRSVATATRPEREKLFERFWDEYPKRKGNPARAHAKERFEALLKAGVDPEEIIAGAKAFAVREADNIGTPYIPQAVKWLRHRCFEDYDGALESTATALPDNLIHIQRDSPDWPKYAAVWRQQRGKDPPVDKRGGWAFPKTEFREAAE